MFVLGMTNEEYENARVLDDYSLISDKFYRVQKMTIKPSSGQIDLMFRHHLETQIIDDSNSKASKRFINIQSLGVLFALNPIKVKVSCIGSLV